MKARPLPLRNALGIAFGSTAPAQTVSFMETIDLAGMKAAKRTSKPATHRKRRPRARCLGSAVFSDVAWVEIASSLQLSGRELEMARGVFDNVTEKALAIDLCASEHTVHTHLRRLFRKLRVTTRAQMVLRLTQEFIALTLSETGCLPPLCPNRAAGRCPLAT